MKLLSLFYPTFVSYLISLDIMILGVFIPIGYNAVSKVISSYGESTAMLYRKKISIQYSFFVVLFHLLFLLFYSSIQSPGGKIEFPIYALSILIFTLITWIVIALAAYNTFQFGYNRPFISKCYKKKANKEFSKSKPLEFYETIYNYGEYLYSQLDTRNLKIVLTGIKDFENFFNEIINLHKTDIDKFNKFIFSKEFLSETDSEKRQYLLLYDRKILIVLILVEQFQQLFNYSTENNIDEVSDNTHISLIRILRNISSIPNMNILVNKILSVLENTSIKTFMHNESESYSTLEWYTLCVFNDYDDRRIYINYLELFNRSLFSILRTSVRKKYVNAIKAFMRLSHTGLYYDYDGPNYRVGSLVDLIAELDQEVYSKIYMLASGLVNKLGVKITKHKLDIFNKQFEIVKKEVSELSLDDNAYKIKEYLENIKISFEEKYKHNEFRVLINYLLSYCITYELTGLVVDFWQYKQPDDANAHHTGDDLFESDLFKFLEFHYSDREFWHARYEFHEDRHGTLKYVNQYNALRVAYNFRHLNELDNKKILDCPTHSVDLLFGLEKSIPQMIEYLEKEIESNSDYKVFRHKEIAFEMAILQLTEIKGNIDSYKSQYISNSNIIPEKVYDISKSIIKNYSDNRKINYIINIIIDSKKIIKRAGREAKSKFNEDKAALIDWRVDYSSYGRFIGEFIADRENAILFKQLSSRSKTCIRLNEDGLKKRFIKIVTKKRTTNLILMNRGFSWEFLRDNNYIRKPNEEDGIFNKKYVNWILVNNDKKTPIFVVKAPPAHFQILLLNTDKVFIDFEDNKNNLISWELFTNTEKYAMDLNKNISNEIITNNETQDLDSTKFEMEISIFPYFRFYKNKTITCIDIVNG